MKINNGRYDILVVDDNKEFAGLLQLLLNHNGYRAEFVTDSLTALRKIQKDKPAVVILDLIMPMMDGLRLCRKIKSNTDTADTKVIIFTGKRFESDRRKALNLGADAFLIKPTRAHLLLGKIKELLAPFHEQIY